MQSQFPVSLKAIMWKGDSVLFLKNPRQEWELPGGRPELGESEQQTVVREVQEECGFDVTHPRYEATRQCEVIPNGFVEIRFFTCDYAEPAVRLSEEHIHAEWILIRGPRPPDVPDFYWTTCANLLRQRKSKA